MIQAGTRSNAGWSHRHTPLFKRGIFRKDMEERLIDEKKYMERP